MFCVTLTPSELTPCKMSHICHCSSNGRCICVKWLNQIIFHSCAQAKLFLRFLHSPSRQKKITHSFRQNVFKNLFPSRKKAGKKKWKSGYENHMFFTSLRTFYISTLLLSCLFACHFFSKFLIFISTQVFVHILLLYRKKK